MSEVPLSSQTRSVWPSGEPGRAVGDRGGSRDQLLALRREEVAVEALQPDRGLERVDRLPLPDQAEVVAVGPGGGGGEVRREEGEVGEAGGVQLVQGAGR